MMKTALILGVGLPEGIGGATAMKFSQEGLHVIIAGRSKEKLRATSEIIKFNGMSVEESICDVTSEADLDAVFAQVKSRSSPLAAVIYNAGNNAPIPFENLTAKQFESYWRVCCLGGFLTAKRALPILAKQGMGSIFFTGASGSLRGKTDFAHFSSAKGALRNLAQALARDYGPKGVHVAHLIIDGLVNGHQGRSRFGGFLDNLGNDGALEPDAIADAFWMLHSQKRSAWTHELDLRPYKEAW